MKTMLLGGLMLAAGVLVAPMSAQLIVNGSFEIPAISTSPGYVTYGLGASDITGWTISRNNVDIVNHYSGWEAADGQQSLDLNGDTAGEIFQDVNGLTAGSTYTLSFAYANNPLGAGGETGVLQIADGATTFVNQVISHTSSAGAGAMDWLTASYNFVAPVSGHARIIFTSFSNPNDPSGGIMIDDVALVPEPATYAALLGLAALGVVVWRRHRRRGV